MNIRKWFASSAAVMLLLTLGGTATAGEVIVCESLEGLNSCLTYLTFTNDKDRIGLQGKLDDAQAKISENKICDAGLKVSDFNAKLFRLATATKPKVSETFDDIVRCALEGSKALANTWLEGCPDAGDPPRGKGRKKK